jgi:hypothetical protein
LHLRLEDFVGHSAQEFQGGCHWSASCFQSLLTMFNGMPRRRRPK